MINLNEVNRHLPTQSDSLSEPLKKVVLFSPQAVQLVAAGRSL